MRVFAILLAATVNLGCTATPARVVGKATPADSAAAAAAAQSINALGCDLYRALKTERGNLTISPLSVSTAMGLTYAGAAGKTREEMQGVLHLPGGDTQAYDGYRSLLALLDDRAHAGGARWTLANRVWVQKGFALQPAYLETTRESFGSEAGELDFQGAAEAGRKTMNQWVEDKTEKRIPDLFPPGLINAMTRLVLANAVYFKGRWAEPFDSSQTRSEPFHMGVGMESRTPMMFITRKFGYAAIADAHVLELPYKGGQLSMVILLPDSVGGLPSLENRLDADSLGAWIGELVEHRVEVGLPRFKATGQFTLTPTLAALGMPSAFDASVADFSGMDGKRDLFISLVVHKAFVEVNEEGTEAAAATGGVATVATIRYPERFVADRPFLWLIRDRASGCVLFLGRLAEPTSH